MQLFLLPLIGFLPNPPFIYADGYCFIYKLVKCSHILDKATVSVYSNISQKYAHVFITPHDGDASIHLHLAAASSFISQWHL